MKSPTGRTPRPPLPQNIPIRTDEGRAIKEALMKNSPYAIIELTKEEYDFLLENCESNISMGLMLMMQVKDRPSAERLVELNEQFKSLREKLRRAVT